MSASALLPEIILLIGGCVVLVLGQAGTERRRRLVPWVTLISVLASLAVTLLATRLIRLDREPWQTQNGLVCGSLAWFVRISALELGCLFTLVNWSAAQKRERGEFLAMMLFSLTGLLLVGLADNLLILFLGLELVGIPTYVLVVLGRQHPAALEAGTKYFYLGALATAVLGYGFSFLYGVSGTASLGEMTDKLSWFLREPGDLKSGLALLGIVFSLGGLLFKIAAVPMHFYIADVYQGASNPVAGLLGFVPKLAGLVAILKLMPLTGQWQHGHGAAFGLLWVVATLSMGVGNLLALRQTNLKRLLAYSGVAHAGYLLVGVLAGPQAGKALAGGGVGLMGDGAAAALFYMVIYGLANLAAFAILELLRARGQACETLRDVAGLWRERPDLALLLALTMVTLMGLPPTAGFWGKLALFGSALVSGRLALFESHNAWTVSLVIIAVLNSVLGAAYYLRVIAALFLYENPAPPEVDRPPAQHLGAVLSGLLLVIFAFYPGGLMDGAKAATGELQRRLAPNGSAGTGAAHRCRKLCEPVLAGKGQITPLPVDDIISPGWLVWPAAVGPDGAADGLGLRHASRAEPASAQGE